MPCAGAGVVVVVAAAAVVAVVAAAAVVFAAAAVVAVVVDGARCRTGCRVRTPATRAGLGWGWLLTLVVTPAGWVAGADGMDAEVVSPRRFQRRFHHRHHLRSWRP